MGKVLSDFGSAASAVLTYIGDRLGLYKAMYDFGKPITSQELANNTGTSERYIREWLANQAAGGYLTYDPSSQRFILPAEHALALVDESSPAYVAGGFQILMSLYRVKSVRCFSSIGDNLCFVLLAEVMPRRYVVF